METLTFVLVIQKGIVLFVAIVHLGGNLPKRVEKDLGGLTPTWMIEIRIWVGPKAVLVRTIIPKRLGPAVQ